MISHIFFYMALSLLLIHEMDAVRCKEWRMIPGFGLVDENAGYLIFLLIHIPLYFFLFWGLFTPGVKNPLIFGLDIFFIVHLGLHLIFRTHWENHFNSKFSWALIIGLAVFASLDLIFTFL